MAQWSVKLVNCGVVGSLLDGNRDHVYGLEGRLDFGNQKEAIQYIKYNLSTTHRGAVLLRVDRFGYRELHKFFEYGTGSMVCFQKPDCGWLYHSETRLQGVQ